ncbi:MAG: TonB-dependent receptor [Gammaproteobacteria bacterium]
MFHQAFSTVRAAVFNPARTALSLLAAVCLLAISAPTFAQQTTSSIRGSVTTPGGEAVAGATVTVVNPATGSTRSTTTNASGTFRLPSLRVGGPYQVTLDGGNGYGQQTVNDVFLELGDAYSLNLVTQSDTVEEVIVSALRDDSRLAIGTSSLFDAENIAGNANINRDFKNIIRQDPRVSIDATNQNAISIAGTNNRFNSLTVDGVRQNDDFGLNNSGFPTQRSPISIDAVEQVSVEIAPFDVSFGGFTGGTINAVTKSGTNDWDGTVSFFKSDDGLAGDNINGNDIDLGNFEEETVSVTFSGPIIKDRLWFFVGYEEFTATDTSALEFGPAGSGRANEIDAVTQTDIDNVLRISNDVYNFNAGALPDNGTDITDEKIIVKLDFDINDKHSITATYQDVTGAVQVPQGNSNFNNRIGLTSNWYQRSEDLESISAQLFSNWTDALSTELKIATQSRETGQNSLSGTDFAQMTIDTPAGGQIRIGPDIFRHANALTNDQIQIKFKGDYLRGNHQYSFGIERETLDVFNLFRPTSEGEYFFDSIADFEAQVASGFNYENAFSNNKIDAGASFEYSITSLYLQDNWDVSDRFSLSYGFRYDSYSSDDTPTLNENFVARNGFANTSTLDGLDIIMPRIGFTYDFDDRTVFRGGVGLFSGGSPNVWIANSFSNDGQTVVTPDDAGNFDAACTDITSSAAVLTGVNGFDIPQVVQDCMFPGAGNVEATDPGFDIPSLWRLSLAVDRQFDFGDVLGDGWNVTAEAVFSRVNDAVEWRDLRRTVIGTAPDGRPIYDTPPNYDVLLTNTGDGKSDTFSLSLDKSWDTRWGIFDGFVAYTRSDVTDVNPSQSSTVSSNYGRPATTDRNGRVEARSDFEIKDRFNGSFGWQKELFGDNTTRVNMFFESRSGKPFSYTMREGSGDTSVFGGDRNFARRDSQLLYVPLMNDPNVVFENAAAETSFNAFVAAAGLEGSRGQILSRNHGTTRGSTRIDMRIQQEIGFGDLPIFGQSKVDLYFDVENLGNLLNDEWGRVEQVGFPFNFVATDVELNDQGQYVYSTRNDDYSNAIEPANVFTLPSLYKIQLGFKVSF